MLIIVGRGPPAAHRLGAASRDEAQQRQVPHLATKQRRRAGFLRSLHIFRPPDHFLTHCKQIDALVLLPILEINETGTR